jgi:tRNA U34 5-methylaminomethyl-2-thiouridine-forming methyltransferase MnmC
MNKTIINTADGSSTVYNSSLNEHYHSVNGAVTESECVYINNGLTEALKTNANKTINILEVGLGTGLNALLTLAKINGMKVQVFYTALEPFTLKAEDVEQLNYCKFPGLINFNNEFKEIHNHNGNDFLRINNNFYFKNICTQVQNFNPLPFTFDIVYYDAFSPEVQPEMWTAEIFDKMYKVINNEGILVTYCAKGQFKRFLKASGFTVECLPGPPGKREVVRAVK